MVAAIAFESLVKLVSLTAVGLFVGLVLFDGFGDLFAKAALQPDIHRLLRFDPGQSFNWIALTLLSLAVVVCLPRQFQVMVVENVDEQHLDRALWLFPLYLLAINLFVLPIALAGRLTLPAGADPDSIVLTVPLAAGQTWLGAAAFIGGLSASAGMLIVSAVALSIMICNDLVMPALLHFRRRELAARADLTRLLLTIRRAAMALVMLLGYLYTHYVTEDFALVSIGLVAFAAVAQFFPAILLGLFWRRATRIAALTGISAGFAVWAYTLFLPSLARPGWLPLDFLQHGPFGIAFLKPYALFGLDGLDPVAHSVFWSMLVNFGALTGISLVTRQSPIERAQAVLFVDAFRSADAAQLWPRTAPLPDLLTLVSRFLGRKPAREAFAAWARRRGRDPTAIEADAEMVLYAERLLAGVIGGASAQVLVSSVVREEPLGIDKVMRILDETSRVIEYNRRLEEKSHELELAGEELRRANERLKEFDRLKDDFVSTVNHELRTPLTSIRSFSEILLDHPELALEQRREFQRIILRETERLTRLINQMLDLAKIQSGQMSYDRAAVDFGEVVREAAAATAQLFREKGIALETAPAAAPVVVWADRDLLTQVLLNLLSNAVKFCPPSAGRVRIAIASADGVGVLAVADNGPGIAPAHREVIFERFRQVGDTLTGKPPGTGLGLAICRMIVRQLGGEIEVSGEPGAGAVFRVRLPLAPAAVARAASIVAAG